MKEALDLAVHMLFDNTEDDKLPPVSKETFYKLAELSLKEVVMDTPNGRYIQITGLAMGSPLSPLLANIWMSQWDKKFREWTAKFFFRYVDDIILTVQEEDIEKRLSEINNWHQDLNFTYEVEDNKGQISFLDMMLIHKGNSIESRWFTKPTSNGGNAKLS